MFNERKGQHNRQNIIKEIQNAKTKPKKKILALKIRKSARSIDKLMFKSV